MYYIWSIITGVIYSLLRSSSHKQACLPTGYEPRPPIIHILETRLGNKLITFTAASSLGNKTEYYPESLKTPKIKPLFTLLCLLVVNKETHRLPTHRPPIHLPTLILL